MRQKTLLTVLVIASFIVSAFAAVHRVDVQYPLPGVGRNDKVIYKEAKASEPQKTKKEKKKVKTGEQLYKVTCRYDLHEGEISPSYFIYNKEVSQNDYDWEDDDTLPEPAEEGTAEFLVPAGKYDIHSSCWVQAAPDESDLVIVIKEGVEVNGDMTLVFNTDEATENIEFEKLLPNGEPMRLTWFDKEGNLDETHKDEVPNVEYWYSDTYIWHKDAGAVDKIISATEYYVSGVVEPGKYRLRINPLSDNYRIFQSSILNDKDGNIYFIRVDANSDGSVTYRNDPSMYLPYTEEFAHTPVYDEMGSGRHSHIVGCKDFVDGYQLGGVLGDFMYDDIRVNVCAPQTKLADDKTLDMMLFYGVYEGGKSMVGLPVRNIDGKWQHVNNNHSEANGNFLFQVPDDGSAVCDLPPHPAYSYMHEEKTMPYGNSAPICSTSVPHEVYENGVHIDFVNPVFIGRYGEVRNQDLLKTEVNVFVSGQCEYTGDPDGFEEWQITRGESDPKPAKVRVMLHNDNVRVDDMSGFSQTELSWDESLEDHTPPTAQMLMFKTDAGVITDRFDHASQGVLEFSAADFNFTGEWYEAAPVNVTVMCLPTGVDDAEMVPLEVEEQPNLFMMPNFGYFYRGSLKDVNVQSPDGWYDLIVILEDMSGNYQMQYLSPAFRIEENVSLSESEIDDFKVVMRDRSLHITGVTDADIDIYNIDGRLLKSAKGAMVNCEDLASGVYVVTISTPQGAKTIKIAV